jgi:hypothetical protein
MHDTKPAHHALQRRDTAHTAGVAAVAVLVVLTVAYMIISYEVDQLYGLVRTVAAVAVLALLLEVRMAQIRRQQRDLEVRLSRAEYWRLYSDVMADLGGGSDAPTSGAPRR